MNTGRQEEYIVNREKYIVNREEYIVSREEYIVSREEGALIFNFGILVLLVTILCCFPIYYSCGGSILPLLVPYFDTFLPFIVMPGLRLLVELLFLMCRDCFLYLSYHLFHLL